MKWLKRKQRPSAVVYNDIHPISDWSNGDARALDGFMKSHTGHKMMRLLNRSVLDICLSTERLTDNKRDIRQGMTIIIQGIRNLASPEVEQRSPDAVFDEPLNYQIIEENEDNLA